MADKMVISELLYYIQTLVANFVIKTETEFYRKKTINAAKIMLFAESDTTIVRKSITLMLPGHHQLPISNC